MRWWAAALAVLALACLFRPVVEGDGVGYFAYEHSLVFDHDLDFTDEYAAAKAAGVAIYLENIDTRTRTGLPANFVPIGSALLALPFYLGAAALRPAGEPQWAAPFTTAFAAASLLYGLLAASLCYVLTRSRPAALAAVTATPLLYYLVAEPGYSHTFSAFLAAAFALAWWRTPGRGTLGWFGLGVLGGLLASVRLQDGALAAIALLDLPRGRLRAAAMLPGLCLGFLPQLLAEHSIFGTWMPGRPAQYQTLDWFPGHYLEVLVSSHNGLFVWTPAALLAVAGWFLVRDRRLRAACFLALALEVAANGPQGDWWGGTSFGMRRLIDLTPFFAVGLAALGARVRPTLAWAAAGLLTLWNLLEMADFAYLIRVDRDPGYLGLLAGQWKALPDLPRLLLEGGAVRDLLLFRAAHRAFDPAEGLALLAIEALSVSVALLTAAKLLRLDEAEA